MPFTPKERQWYLRAWGNGDVNNARCQSRDCSEERGFFLDCQVRGSKLFVARWTVSEWGTVGIPFCRHHFMGLADDSIYPEVAAAYHDYPQDRTSFSKLVPFSPHHRTRIGDLGTDIYFFQYASSVLLRYRVNHTEDKFPSQSLKPESFPKWIQFTSEASDESAI